MLERKNKNPHIQEYIEQVIKKSWTWERLTEEEQKMAYIVLTATRSKAITPRYVSRVVNNTYNVILKTLRHDLLNKESETP